MQTLRELLNDCNRSKHPVGYWGDNEHWLVAFEITRDSDAITQSNWEVFNRELEKIDSDEQYHTIERFSHWAICWIDRLLIAPNSPLVEPASQLLARLENYPILDDDHFSALELSQHIEYLESIGYSEICDHIGELLPRQLRDYIDDFPVQHYTDEISIGESIENIAKTLYENYHCEILGYCIGQWLSYQDNPDLLAAEITHDKSTGFDVNGLPLDLLR